MSLVVEFITDMFEVVGLVGLAVAAGVFLGRFDLALAIAGGSCVLIASSVAVTLLAGRRRT